MIDLSVVISKSPQPGFQGAEAFDLAMAGAVFDWEIALFFIGDGLAHCFLNPTSEATGNLSKRWLSAKLFGVERMYRLNTEWPEGIELGPIANQVLAVSATELQSLLAQSRRVMVI